MNAPSRIPGIGIAPKDMPLYSQNSISSGRSKKPQEKGTGLGLVISKRIIELHNGQISVESKEGTGTKFSFTLPKAPAGPQRKEDSGEKNTDH